MGKYRASTGTGLLEFAAVIGLNVLCLYYWNVWNLPHRSLSGIIHTFWALFVLLVGAPTEAFSAYFLTLVYDCAVGYAQWNLNNGKWNVPSLDVPFPPDEDWKNLVKLGAWTLFPLITLYRLWAYSDAINAVVQSVPIGPQPRSMSAPVHSQQQQQPQAYYAMDPYAPMKPAIAYGTPGPVQYAPVVQRAPTVYYQ